MDATRIRIGDRVVIKAHSNADWAFVDGWEGEMRGYVSGVPHVASVNPDGILCHFFVPMEHLDLVPGSAASKIIICPAL